MQRRAVVCAPTLVVLAAPLAADAYECLLRAIMKGRRSLSRRAFCFALAFAVLAVPLTADAQTAAKLPQIGILRTSARGAPDPALDGFRQGLRDLGYVEGQNVHLEYRWAEGKPGRVAALAAELVRLNMDVIVTGGEQAILAVRQATATIPIVMGASNDPVSAGLVAPLGRPGGNVTGMTILSAQLSRKRLELLKEVLPRISRVAVVYNPAFPGTVLDLRETRNAARELGLTLHDVEVRSSGDFDVAIGRAREHVDAMISLADPFFTAHRARIVALATRHRLPAMYYWKEFVESGGLMAYGPSLFELYRHAAGHVDKILKGANPADLPVEQPTTFELAVNLRTAKTLDLAIPPSVLARAHLVAP